MFKVRLGTALAGLVLIAVLATAGLVHVTWMRSASRNIESVVTALSGSAAAAVERELDQRFASSEASVEIIRSILFQGAVKAGDEVKREPVFLAVLRSQPAVSWIGFGFPDGRFFGAHALGNGQLEMVEIGPRIDETQRSLRRDSYRLIPGDIFFEARMRDASAYVPQGAKWFRAAKKQHRPVWSEVDILPSGFEPAAVVSVALEQYGRFEGVAMASLSLDNLSAVLATLDIAREGAVRIVNAHGTVLAASPTAGAERFAAALAMDSGNALVQVPGGGAHYVARFPLRFGGWRLETVIPRSVFTSEIDRNLDRLLVLVAALVIAGAGVAAAFAHLAFARPVAAIAAEIRHVESFALEEIRHIASPLAELDRLSAALKRMAVSLGAFGLYVPREIVRTLLDRGVEPKPGGEIAEVTVLFADLPGFTKLTERFGADVAPFLTEFLTLATAAIHREGGTVDKFIGDCIMGVWNAPLPHGDHAAAACRAALAISKSMHALPRPDGETEGARVRIGINTGPALAGNIGSDERLSYTVIGDTVNIASRLEALAKDLGVEIVIGPGVARALPPHFHLAPKGLCAIRGRADPIEAFALLRGPMSC